jgi:fatty acid desaturase
MTALRAARAGALALWAKYEVPTWLLIVTIYGCWVALTLWWHALPFWLVAPAGAWLCAWHMSLQHELMHGHPTRSAAINAMLGWPPLNCWLPYAIYRESHLRHHRDEHLTDPLEDPESTYMSGAAWDGAGRVGRWLHGACNTLAGRLLLGPAMSIGRFWVSQLRRAHGAPSRGVWLRHAVGVALVLGWVQGVCGIGVFGYMACFIYPGTALTMLRSLAEHRAAELPEDRTAVVEHGGLLGLLFLNNNLHVLHHAQPSLPWYALPAHWRQAKRGLLNTRRGPVYRDYLEVARRYALRPQHPGPHPAAGKGASLDSRIPCDATSAWPPENTRHAAAA